jgi:uncharacterized protein YecT (DUF1311 family)
VFGAAVLGSLASSCTPIVAAQPKPRSTHVTVSSRHNTHSQLTGAWDVVRVLVDGQDQMHWAYRPDDPQLLGRALVFKAKTAAFGGRELSCKQISWQSQSLSWAQILAKSFPRPTDGGRSATPTPRDFELDVSPSASATVSALCPAKGSGIAAILQGEWAAQLEDGRIALRLDTTALLLLKQRARDAKIVTSFDCSKATTPAERTVCSDFDLAAWDRSVAMAYDKRSDDGETAELIDTQRAWLEERDACGSDKQCLALSMANRTAWLASPWR